MVKIRWPLDFPIPISQEHCLNNFFGDRPKTCMIAAVLSLSAELLFLRRRPFNISCTVPSTSNLSRILVIITFLVVAYQIQSSNVIELQHSPLSNNISVSTYVYRMIISPPRLFKHMKNDERVPMPFQCLLDHTQQKLYFCLISLLINNVSKSVYINLRHSAQGGREISAILLTVVGECWKDQKCIYHMGSSLDSFLRKRCFLFCFLRVVLLISL